MDRSSKNPGPSPEHRLNVILEELQGQFRTFGEGLGDLQEKVSKIEVVVQKIPGMEADIKMIKSIIPTLASKKDLEPLATKKDLEVFEKRLKAIETH